MSDLCVPDPSVPDWTPPPDVVFDHARARQLIDDAGRIAHTLRTLVTAERAALARARRSWVGRVRTEIDDRAERHESSTELAIQRLQQLLLAMDVAVDDALREQTRRREVRAAWAAQCRAEAANPVGGAAR